MHPIRAFAALALFGTAVFYSSNLLGTIRLTDVMSVDEQNKTGVAKLTDVQKKELESWINDKFVLKTVAAPPLSDQSISLQQNMQNGSQLMFSDGSLYEVAPADRSKTSFWLTPIPVTIQSGNDPQYPFTITNTLTNVSVSARLITAPSPDNGIQP